MEDTLEKPIGRAVMDEYFAAKDKSKNDDLVQLLLSMSRSDLSPEFAARVLKFFNKLFAMHEKNPQDEATERLCSSLSKVKFLRTLFFFLFFLKSFFTSFPTFLLGHGYP